MKITKQQLRQIIKEEVQSSIAENATALTLDQKISKAVEMIELGDPQGGVAVLYDVLEDIRSDDPEFNPIPANRSEEITNSSREQRNTK